MKVFATKGNLNNHIGVPLSLLSIPPDADIAIIEMGTNQPGDIAELVNIARPTHGLITNIGHAHLEKLGNLDGVRREKGVLYEHVKAVGGTIFVNMADPHLVKAAGHYDQVVTYNTPQSLYRFEIIRQNLKEMEIEIFHKNRKESLHIHSNLSGSYNAINILAAVAIGDFFGISQASIQKGILSYKANNNRSQIVKREQYAIWLDAYNANPDSMRESVANIFKTGEGKIALILGDMLELGEKSQEMHDELVAFTASHQPYLLIGVGEQMKAALATIEGNHLGFANVSELLPQLPELIKDVDWVLIKGSRGMALEQCTKVI